MSTANPEGESQALREAKENAAIEFFPQVLENNVRRLFLEADPKATKGSILFMAVEATLREAMFTQLNIDIVKLYRADHKATKDFTPLCREALKNYDPSEFFQKLA